MQPVRVSLSVRTDKVAPREICPQVFGPSKTEPLSLHRDKVQDVTRRPGKGRNGGGEKQKQQPAEKGHR